MGQVKKINEKYDTFEAIEKRLRLLVGARWRNRSKMKDAAKVQDDLRKKLGQPEEGWDSVSEVRKWRESR